MSETYPCSACCAETENEPQAICDACDQADREATARRLNDMALLIRQLAYALNRHAPEHSLTFKAKDYLIRHGLQGSLLRDEPEL